MFTGVESVDVSSAQLHGRRSITCYQSGDGAGAPGGHGEHAWEYAVSINTWHSSFVLSLPCQHIDGFISSVIVGIVYCNQLLTSGQFELTFSCHNVSSFSLISSLNLKWIHKRVENKNVDKTFFGTEKSIPTLERNANYLLCCFLDISPYPSHLLCKVSCDRSRKCSRVYKIQWSLCPEFHHSQLGPWSTCLQTHREE